MADEKPGATEEIRAAHIEDGVSQSLSTDGTVAMFVFRLADGSKFGITCETAKVGLIRAMSQRLAIEAGRRELAKGLTFFRVPKAFNIGNAETARGHVIMVFDPETEDEMAYMMADGDAMNIAVGLQNDVMSRMTEADRAKFLGGQKTLIVPARKQIIMPPGGGKQ